MNYREQRIYYIYRDSMSRYKAVDSRINNIIKYGDIVNVISCSDEASFIRQCLMYSIPDKNIKDMLAKDLKDLPKSSELLDSIKEEEKELTKELENVIFESNKKVKELTDEIEMAKLLREYTNSVGNGKYSEEVITFLDRLELYNRNGNCLDDETLNFIETVIEQDYKEIKKQGFLDWQIDNSAELFKTLRVKELNKGIIEERLDEEDYQLTLAKNIGEHSNQITLCAMFTNLMEKQDTVCMYYTLLESETPACNCLAYDIGIIYQMLKKLSKNQRANLIKGYNNFIKGIDNI